jgi:nucleotide-binding universal stress UspA family protein
MIAIKDILVPMDLGAPSRRALETAVELARKFDANVTVVHVFDAPLAYSGMDLPPRDLLAPIWDEDRAALEALLTEVRATLPDAKLLFAQGTPWREVLRTIEQVHPDLVVMGTRGHRGLERALLGSVTEKIVRLSPAPVLTMRAEDDS